MPEHPEMQAHAINLLHHTDLTDGSGVWHLSNRINFCFAEFNTVEQHKSYLVMHNGQPGLATSLSNLKT